MKHLIARIGKGRCAWADLAVKDWFGRLEHYTGVEERLLPCAELRTGKTVESIQEAESQSLWALVRPGDRVISLDERGRALTTPELARTIERAGPEGARRLLFFIGGPYGHAPWMSSRAHLVLALSSLVLNHELARVVLFEQLYRVHSLLRGEPYHHA